MEQVKIFYSPYVTMERELNKWFAENPSVVVVRVLQTGVKDGLMYMSVFYTGNVVKKEGPMGI